MKFIGLTLKWTCVLLGMAYALYASALFAGGIDYVAEKEGITPL